MTGPLPIAVVIPCFKVRRHIGAVLNGLSGQVQQIYAVDDACPEATGQFIRNNHPAVTVLTHPTNGGVGGAVLTGYARALADGHRTVVKMDGDNQMDPAYLPALIAPVLNGTADYAKGNRFFAWRSWGAMPPERLIGNLTVSLLMKAISGYPHLMDPTNGYTAISAATLQQLPLDRIERRWFFECDMLFRLSALNATVQDIPIPALYADEVSGLGPGPVLREFPLQLLRRTIERKRQRRINTASRWS